MPQIVTQEVGAYDFKDNEPAVVCIEMLPHRYVQINGCSMSLGKEVVLEDGKMVKKWTTDPDGRMWVPSRLISPLTLPQGENDKKHNVSPLAQVVGSRTEAQWKSGVDPLKEEPPVEGKAQRRKVPSGGSGG